MRSVREIEFDPSERIVFLAIMRALAPTVFSRKCRRSVTTCARSASQIASTRSIICSKLPSSRPKEAIDDILDRIRNLPPPDSAPQAERSSKLANLLFNAKPDMSRPGQTVAMEMPLDYMQNWNATTFAHLLESACQDHNLEMASLMLSSCYRLGFTLPHQAITHTITLFLHSEEPRAAVELADLMEQGGLVHRHDATMSAEKSTSRTPIPPARAPAQVKSHVDFRPASGCRSCALAPKEDTYPVWSSHGPRRSCKACKHRTTVSFSSSLPSRQRKDAFRWPKFASHTSIPPTLNPHRAHRGFVIAKAVKWSGLAGMASGATLRSSV